MVVVKGDMVIEELISLGREGIGVDLGLRVGEH
jgi:hypothetical protein